VGECHIKEREQTFNEPKGGLGYPTTAPDDELVSLAPL
jgi:hypothetical protein